MSPSFPPTSVDYFYFTNGRSYVSRLSYNQLEMKNEYWTGNCLPWRKFISDLLAWDQLFQNSLSRFNFIGAFDSHLRTPIQFTCSDSLVLIGILQSLSEARQNATRSFQCDGNTWVTKFCGKGKPAVCIDCADPCRSNTTRSLPFVINPCQESLAYSPKVALITADLNNSYAPPSIIGLNVVPKETSAVVSVEVNGTLSLVRCGVFAAPTKDITLDDVLVQNRQQLYARSIVTFEISSLLPASDYEVFCYTTNALSFRSALTELLETRTSFRTKCCRAVLIDLLTPVVSVNSTVTPMLRVRPETPSPLILRIIVSLSVAGGGVSDIGTVTFNPGFITPIFLPVPSTLTGVVGTHNLSTRILRSRFNGYVSEFPSGTQIKVVAAGAQVKPPSLVSTAFSPDGSSVLVQFSADTNRAEITTSWFPCSDLLEFNDMTLSRCSWVSHSTVKVLLLPGLALFGVGDTVKVVARNLRALCVPGNMNCSSWEASFPASSVVTAPLSGAVNPFISLTGPSTIQLGSDLQLDLSHSSGAGGRKWENVSFRVTSLHARTTEVTAFLDEQYDTRKPFSVPAHLLSNGSYYFLAHMCNFLGACSFDELTVSVKGAEVFPVVSIAGPSLRKVRKDQESVFFADAFFPSTNENSCATSRENILFHWTVKQNSIMHQSNFMTSVDGFLRIPAHVLQSGQVYEVEVTVSSSTSWAVSSAKIIVHVRASELFAIINGGSSQFVPVGSSIVLDGSGSYDTDLNRDIFAAEFAGLLFEWSCQGTTALPPTDSSLCGLKVLGSRQASMVELLATATSGESTVVTLSVYDESRFSTASVVVTVTDANAPRISMSHMHMYDLRTNVNEKTKFFAEVSTVSNGSAIWTVNDSSVDLSKSSLTPVKYSLSSLSTATASLNSISLVLAGHALPGRATLTFTLHVELTNGFIGTNSLTMKTNGAPINGAIVASPSHGYAVLDSFSFVAENWFDEDLPLSYAFGYVDRDRNELFVRNRSPLNVASSKLPTGDANASFGLTGFVRVFDSFSASSTSFLNVTVMPLSWDTTFEALTGLAAEYYYDSMNCSTAAAIDSLQRINVAASILSEGRDSRSTLAPCNETCSSHGRCETPHVCAAANNLSLALDALHHEQCACAEGWAGLDCDELLSNIEARRSFRTVLLEELENAIQSSLYDVTGVSSWLNTLRLLSSGVDEVSYDFTERAWKILNVILVEAEELAVPYETILPAVDIFDNLMQAERLFQNNSIVSDQDFRAFAFLNDIFELDMVAGQYDIEFVRKSFRLVFTDQELFGNTNSISLTLPEAAHLGTFSAENLQNSSSSFFSVGFVPFHCLITEQEVITSPVLLSIGDENPCGPGGCSFEARFNHADPHYLQEMNTELLSVVCQSNQAENFTYGCANGYNATVECDGVFAGFVNATCPYDLSVPSCVVVDGSNVTLEGPGCEVSFSNASVTSCSCPADAGDKAIQVAVLKKFVHYPSEFSFLVSPTPAPTAAPSESGLFPIISLTLRSWITLRNTSSSSFSAKDKVDCTNTTAIIILDSNVTSSEVSFINATLVSVDDNPQTSNFTQVALVQVILSTNAFCSADAAFIHYAHQLQSSIVNSSLFTNTLREEAETAPVRAASIPSTLLHAYASNVFTSLVRFSAVSTNSSYCETSGVTASPTLPPSAGIGSPLASFTEGNSAEVEYRENLSPHNSTALAWTLISVGLLAMFVFAVLLVRLWRLQKEEGRAQEEEGTAPFEMSRRSSIDPQCEFLFDSVSEADPPAFNWTEADSYLGDTESPHKPGPGQGGNLWVE